MKREAVKYIRDKAKSAYIKRTSCYVCGTSRNLELHHVFSISELFTIWCRKAGIVIRNEKDILAHREAFIEAHHKEIYDDVFTLCKEHHKKLHSLFGQHPRLPTGPKQILFLNKLRKKLGYTEHE